MADPGIFQFVGESVDRALASFVSATSSQVIADITPLAISGVTLYLAIYGYMVIAGRVQAPAGTFVIQSVKIIFIGALALSAGGYMQWVAGSIHGLEDGLTSAFATTSSDDGDTESVYATLDETLGEGFDIAADLWESGTNRGVTEFGQAISDFVNATVIGLATIAVGLPAGVMIVLAKATLTLLLGIGPLFVMCLLWKPTARFFDAWAAQVFSSVLTIALVAAVAAFTMKIFSEFLGRVDLGSDQSTLFTALQLIVLSGVLLCLLYKTGSIAGGLAGGLSTAAITLGQLAGLGTKAAGIPGAAGRAVNNTLNPTSTRLDPNTGHQTTSRRAEHVLQGRTVFAPNPKYRSALMERYRAAWGKQNEVRNGR